MKTELNEKEKAYEEVVLKAKSLPVQSDLPDSFQEAKACVHGVQTMEHEVELEFLRRMKKVKGGKDA